MELRLILEVEKRPMLYDKEVNVYKKQNVRDEAWRDVAAILNISEPECRKKWRGLRDQFIKIYKNEQTKGVSKRKTPWIYYNQMLFLVPHIGLKESCGFWKHTSDSGIEEDSKLIRSPTTSDSQEEPPSKHYKKNHQRESEEEKLSVRGDDPDEQFLLSYLPTLRRFTPRQNAVARMRIQQVLYEIEFGNEENNDGNSYKVYLSSPPPPPNVNDCIKSE